MVSPDEHGALKLVAVAVGAELIDHATQRGDVVVDLRAAAASATARDTQ